MNSVDLPAVTPTPPAPKPKTYKNPFISPLTKNTFVHTLVYQKPRAVSNVVDSHYSAANDRQDGEEGMPPTKRSRSDGHRVPLSLTLEHLPGDRAGNLAAIQELAKGYDASKPFGASSLSAPASSVKEEYSPGRKENELPQHPPSDDSDELHHEQDAETGHDSLMEIEY